MILFDLDIVEYFSLYVFVIWVAAFVTSLVSLVIWRTHKREYALETLAVLALFGMLISYGHWDASKTASDSTFRPTHLWVTYYIMRTASLGMAITILARVWRLILDRSPYWPMGHPDM